MAKRPSSSQLLKKCRNFKATDPIAPKIIRTKKRGKGNGIMKVATMKDINGKEYTPFCNFSWHTGIILDNPDSCIQKRCTHYRTAYLEKANYKKIVHSKYHLAN